MGIYLVTIKDRAPNFVFQDSKEAGLVLKYYPDKSPFVILFPDGTGNALYPFIIQILNL